MNTPKKLAYVHKHIHYHYHCDGNDRYEAEPIQKNSSRSTLTTQASHIFEGRSSWKKHIDPQLTKLYEEVSQNQSFEDTYTPKVQRYGQEQLIQWSDTPHHAQTRQNSESRQQLLNNLQRYEEYLKKRSGANLYIPNSDSILKFRCRSSDHFQRQKLETFKETSRFNQYKHRNLEDIARTRADSKIITERHYDSTTGRQQSTNYPLAQARINLGKQREAKVIYSAHSQIKSLKGNSTANLAKIRMSHLEGGSKKQEEQVSNFSLFQRQSQNNSHRVNSQTLSQQGTNKFGRTVPQAHLQFQQGSHSYELMKEECNFLRNKFIQHIQNKPNIKF